MLGVLVLPLALAGGVGASPSVIETVAPNGVIAKQAVSGQLEGLGAPEVSDVRGDNGWFDALLGARPGRRIYTWCIATLALVVLFILLRRELWRLPVSIEPQWWAKPEVLVGGWVLFLLVGFTGASLAPVVFSPESKIAGEAIRMMFAYAGQFVVALLVVVLLVRASARRRHHQPESASVSHAMRPIAAFGAGCLGFLVALPLAQGAGGLVGFLQEFTTGMQTADLAHETLQSMREDSGGVWSITVMVLVLTATPLLEEFTYRGLLQQGFRRLGADRASAILIGSIIFVFMHLPALPGASVLSAATTLLVLSLVLGWLFERTGSLIAPVVAHALFNGANLLLLASGV